MIRRTILVDPTQTLPSVASVFCTEWQNASTKYAQGKARQVQAHRPTRSERTVPYKCHRLHGMARGSQRTFQGGKKEKNGNYAPCCCSCWICLWFMPSPPPLNFFFLFFFTLLTRTCRPDMLRTALHVVLCLKSASVAAQ